MAIRDENRSARDATGGCADRVSAVARGEVEALFRVSNSWAAVQGDKTLASVSNGGCLTVEAAGAGHEVGSAKANGCVVDGAAWLARGVANEAGRVPMSPDPADCTIGDGNFYAGAVAATDGLLTSA